MCESDSPRAGARYVGVDPTVGLRPPCGPTPTYRPHHDCRSRRILIVALHCSLFEALVDRGEHPRTIANYLEGLIGLGLHGKAGDGRLAGLREMRAVAAVRARRIDKQKVDRIASLTERGGFTVIAEAIARLRSDAEGLPAWSAAAERLRRAAAVLAVEINAYGRTGDVAAWRLGIDLDREPWGAWRLAWSQSKTSGGQDVGELWPEVGEVLDELALAGRPRRYAALRYTEPAAATG